MACAVTLAAIWPSPAREKRLSDLAFKAGGTRLTGDVTQDERACSTALTLRSTRHLDRRRAAAAEATGAVKADVIAAPTTASRTPNVSADIAELVVEPARSARPICRPTLPTCSRCRWSTERCLPTTFRLAASMSRTLKARAQPGPDHQFSRHSGARQRHRHRDQGRADAGRRLPGRPRRTRAHAGPARRAAGPADLRDGRGQNVTLDGLPSMSAAAASRQRAGSPKRSI